MEMTKITDVDTEFAGKNGNENNVVDNERAETSAPVENLDCVNDTSVPPAENVIVEPCNLKRKRIVVVCGLNLVNKNHEYIG